MNSLLALVFIFRGQQRKPSSLGAGDATDIHNHTKWEATPSNQMDISWGPVLISDFQLRHNKVEEEQPWLLWPLMSSLIPKQHQHFTHTLHILQIRQHIAHSRRKEINPSFGTHLTHANSFASVLFGSYEEHMQGWEIIDYIWSMVALLSLLKSPMLMSHARITIENYVDYSSDRLSACLLVLTLLSNVKTC